MHHEIEAFGEGALTFVAHNAPDSVIAYRKKSENEEILVVVNATGKAVSVRPEADLIGTTPVLRCGVARRLMATVEAVWGEA